MSLVIVINGKEKRRKTLFSRIIAVNLHLK